MLNAAFKPKFPVLGAELNRNPKIDQKACLMHALFPRFLDFDATSS